MTSPPLPSAASPLPAILAAAGALLLLAAWPSIAYLPRRYSHEIHDINFLIWIIAVCGAGYLLLRAALTLESLWRRALVLFIFTIGIFPRAHYFYWSMTAQSISMAGL